MGGFAGSCSCAVGFGGAIGIILVLYILLVIIVATPFFI